MLTTTDIAIARIEDAYRELHTGSAHTPVRIADLRAKTWGWVSDAAFNAAITRMASREGVHVRAEADRKTLTQDDHDAAVILGGTPRHTLLILG